MLKLLGVFVAGMFVGAVCVEVLARTKPELVDAIGGTAENLADMFVNSPEGESEAEAMTC
jgi:hypothetical protein